MIAELRFETEVEQPKTFQIEVLAEHDGPGHEAEDQQANHDELVDGAAALKNFDDIDSEER
jgi:hypothetical protein